MEEEEQKTDEALAEAMKWLDGQGIRYRITKDGELITGQPLAQPSGDMDIYVAVLSSDAPGALAFRMCGASVGDGGAVYSLLPGGGSCPEIGVPAFATDDYIASATFADGVLWYRGSCAPGALPCVMRQVPALLASVYA